MTLNLQANIDNTNISVIKADDYESYDNIPNTSVYKAGGWAGLGSYYWDSSMLVVTQKYDLPKGNYIIRISRNFDHRDWESFYRGTQGSGLIKLKLSMELPGKPAKVKASAAATNSLKVTWSDVVYGYTEGKAYYPVYQLGYRVHGSKSKYKYVNIKTNKYIHH